MLHMKSFLAIIRWDLVLELRRREAVMNMTLFAVLILFIASYGLSWRLDLEGIRGPGGSIPSAEVRDSLPDLLDISERQKFGPLILWISILFAGTVGLSRAFAVEKEGGALTGILVSPIDPGVFYLAKAAATWLYVMAMEVLVLLAYIILFNFAEWDRIPLLFTVMGAFTLCYVAAGTVIAALTTSLRGGEVLLRILLFPIMIPAVMIVLRVGDSIFPATAPPGTPEAWKSLAALAALGTIYLLLGFVLFPKVVEE